MSWEKAIGLISALVAIVAGGVAIYDHFQEDAPATVAPAAPSHPPQITVLARTAFNDSGRAYIEDFDGSTIPLNGSIRVVYIA